MKEMRLGISSNKLTEMRNSTELILILKGQGHVTVNKPIISIIYIVANMWQLCSEQILVDGGDSTRKLLQKIQQHLSNNKHMSVSFVSLRNSRVHLQNNSFILRKIVENLCDMAY